MKKQFNVLWRSQLFGSSIELYLAKDGSLTSVKNKAVKMSREECNDLLIAINATEAWSQGGKDSCPEIVGVV